MDRVHKYFKYLTWGALLGIVAGISAGIGMATIIAWQVYFGDDSSLRKTTIMAKIKEETTLYYLDETTRIGSFFESQHRRYIPIEEVPPNVNNAVIAAEDKNFYHHPGIDPVALFKAFGEGIANGGHFRRGGSTITSQTVKNIMDDWEPSFSRKFREMIKALQLERLYNKQQILEFYLNQFHVAGNGNGIGIAAKYYFNKDVRDLNLVEAAFIAGSVKGPGKYNPFIKFTQKTRDQATAFANERKNYVLRRMFEQDWISKDEFSEAIKLPVPFNRGEFRTAEVALVELVRSQLQKKEILEALNLTSIDDLNIAGLRVFTTLDAEFQKRAQLAMRRNLSRLETILQGFSPEKKEEYKPQRTLVKNEFYFGKVEKINGTTPDDTSISVSFGLPTGKIPVESMIRYGKLLDLPVGHAQGWKYHIGQLRSTLKPGDIVYVEVVDINPETNETTLELKKRPRISGGLVAIDKGEVRAVISGFDTLGFNRAMHAKKPPGSVFKSVVFFAAMTLGWSMLDQVDNDRQVFPFQGQFYYPRGDHDSPYRSVSMLWAGIKSENIGSVSMASRLVEKLNLDQFKELMGFMGLMPESGEAPRDFHFRVSRETGVSLDNKGVREFQLQNAVSDVAPDLVFSGSHELLSILRKMWIGDGYDAELANLTAMGTKKYSVKELRIRRALLKNNFARYKHLSDELATDWGAIIGKFGQADADAAFADPSLQHVLKRFRVMPSAGEKPELGYFNDSAGENISDDFSYDEKSQVDQVPGRALNVLDAQAIWGRSSLFGSAGSANISMDNVKLSGRVPSGILVQLEKFLNSRYDSVVSNGDQYDLPRYFQHHDFRAALGLMYLVKLSKALGVTSKLEPVLSYPLGTNDVSISEVAKLYQTFIDGKTFKFFDKGPDNQLTFIRRIEDRLGNVLYEMNRKEHQTVKREFALQMREILRRVVTHGTGNLARGELHVSLDSLLPEGTAKQSPPNPDKFIRITAFGKTGTTNDFTTSSFAGFLPYPVEKGGELDPSNSYAIAAYVGYDQNKTMTRGRFKVFGSAGALPVWTDFAKEIIEERKYVEKLDPLDLSVISQKVWPIKFDKTVSPIMVDLPRGLVIKSGGTSESEMFGATDIATTGESFTNEFALGNSVKSVVYVPADFSSGTWQPMRMFAPFSAQKPNGDPSEGDLPGAKTEGDAPESPGVAKLIKDPQPGNRVSTADPKPANPVNGANRVKPPVVKPVNEGKEIEPAERPAGSDLAKPTLKPETKDSPEGKSGVYEPEDDTGYSEEDLW
jgi:membrane peptidoglycan carboxypeptidase